ncbi:MAG: hypothetical protein MJ209_06895 [archaeon]|nr:hypothetical protein [archaeon]
MSKQNITKTALGFKDLFTSEEEKIKGCYFIVEMNYKDSTFSILFSKDKRGAQKQYALFTSLNEAHDVKEALKLVKVYLEKLDLKPVDEYYKI